MIKIWGARGRKFESCHPDLRKSEAEMFRSFVVWTFLARFGGTTAVVQNDFSEKINKFICIAQRPN